MIVLPIYYTQHFKTKPSKTFLVGMNWYRNAHHHISNTVKKHYTDLVEQQSLKLNNIDGEYTLEIEVYYKNGASDGSNISSLMEKYVLDALQKLNIVVNDNVKYHKGTTWKLMGQDKEHPRVVINIKGQTNE